MFYFKVLTLLFFWCSIQLRMGCQPRWKVTPQIVTSQCAIFPLNETTPVRKSSVMGSFKPLWGMSSAFVLVLLFSHQTASCVLSSPRCLLVAFALKIFCPSDPSFPLFIITFFDFLPPSNWKDALCINKFRCLYMVIMVKRMRLQNSFQSVENGVEKLILRPPQLCRCCSHSLEGTYKNVGTHFAFFSAVHLSTRAAVLDGGR